MDLLSYYYLFLYNFY